ncbi:MAG: hypothetical protein MK108_00370 [Mariniblastus sp.]|nr:hypothetical protein [Mariniblastus sp.]
MSPVRFLFGTFRLALVGLACTWALPCPAWQLGESEFHRLHDELHPTNELWKSIPWQTSLITAQNVAVTEGKPIFIWAMDGHPLGCT